MKRIYFGIIAISPKAFFKTRIHASSMSYQEEQELGTTPDGKSTHLLYNSSITEKKIIAKVRMPLMTAKQAREIFEQDFARKLENAIPQTDARICDLTLKLSMELPYQIQFIQDPSCKEIERDTIKDILEYNETWEMYQKVTLEARYKSEQSEAWIGKIIRGEKEQDKVIFKNDDVVVVKDSKWKQPEDEKEMHYIMLFADKTLTCIRDLEGQHISMLQKGMEEALQQIEEKHGMTRERLRIYFHYHPNYWRLHVHIVAHSSSSISMNNSFGFEQVLQNLAIDSSWYQTYSLPVKLQKHGKWYEKYLEFLQQKSMDFTMAAL